jgi:hypothetical protein
MSPTAGNTGEYQTQSDSHHSSLHELRSQDHVAAAQLVDAVLCPNGPERIEKPPPLPDLGAAEIDGIEIHDALMTTTDSF